jgi:hypothetical protein
MGAMIFLPRDFLVPKTAAKQKGRLFSILTKQQPKL